MKRVLSLWILCLFSFSGCRTTYGVPLDNLDYSFRLVILAINQNLPGGVMNQSGNSREWTSHYFVIDDGHTASKKKNLDHAPERAQAQILIMGDRRPYKLDIVVWVEERQITPDGMVTYKRVRKDQEVASQLADQIDDFLVKSRDNRDLIDDFRAF